MPDRNSRVPASASISMAGCPCLMYGTPMAMQPEPGTAAHLVLGWLITGTVIELSTVSAEWLDDLQTAIDDARKMITPAMAVTRS